LECPARVDEPIRMQHGDAALELGLHLGIAGGGETQLAELLVLLAEGTAAQRCGDPGDKYQTLRLHGYLRARAISHRPPCSGLLRNVILRMRCRLMASGPAVQGQEFGIVHLGCYTGTAHMWSAVSMSSSTVRTENAMKSGREGTLQTNTTLADLFTPLLAANPFSTMRASLRR